MSICIKKFGQKYQVFKELWPFLFPKWRVPSMMLFLVTEKSPISVCMHGDDVIGNFCIAN